LFEDIRSVVDCFADNFNYCGEVGTAIAIKLINNVIAPGTAILANEAMAAVRKAGTDKQVLYDVLSAGGADSVMFRRMAQNMVHDGDTTFER
jgi:3-hydroxyisobutyrate dehydrogenase-like beta-hydroxyacid dehydrogenase